MTITVTREPGIYLITLEHQGHIIRQRTAYNRAMAHDVARILSELHHGAIIAWLTD